MCSDIVSGQILKKLFQYGKQFRAPMEQYKVIQWLTDWDVQPWQALRDVLLWNDYNLLSQIWDDLNAALIWDCVSYILVGECKW